MKLTTNGATRVDEHSYGMYVWVCPDGEVLGDGEGNIMNVFSHSGDQEAARAITEAAKYYGYPEGRVEFWPGKRPITDEEYEEQKTRAKLGLIPDPLDHGAFRDDMYGQRHGY